MDGRALAAAAKALGAKASGCVRVEDMCFERAFRRACEDNSCGKYGTNWMCPPGVGDIDALIVRAQRFSEAFVYQSVGALEDSFDIEGMLRAGKAHRALAQALNDALEGDFLHLCAGSCDLCESCAQAQNQPCRQRERALPPLEAYGVDVYKLAQLAGLQYINGQNTVTYFGAVLFNG